MSTLYMMVGCPGSGKNIFQETKFVLSYFKIKIIILQKKEKFFKNLFMKLKKVYPKIVMLL